MGANFVISIRMTCSLILSVLRGFAIALVILSMTRGVVAAELVMFESATCTWCDRWNEEIAPIYPNTSEAKCAPLRRVDISDTWPVDLQYIERIVYTPTFVIVDDGQEVGRLVGYPGEDFFWPLLADQLVKLPQGCPN